MPSITIRFDWSNASDDDALKEQTLRELAAHLQFRTIDAFSDGGEELMGYDGALVGELTIDAIVDDGRGITAADRVHAELDAELGGKTHARVEEYHTEEV